jgi:hypothetical protein
LRAVIIFVALNGSAVGLQSTARYSGFETKKHYRLVKAEHRTGIIGIVLLLLEYTAGKDLILMATGSIIHVRVSRV